MLRPSLLLGLLLSVLALLRADDGHDLWLRDTPLPESPRREQLRAACVDITLTYGEGAETVTTELVREELTRGIGSRLGVRPHIRLAPSAHAAELGADGFEIARAHAGGNFTVRANTDKGLLYGAYALLRELAQGKDPAQVCQVSRPNIQRRILNHWDDLDGFVERGYSGRSIWEWWILPEVVSPRYREYARACASVGINGAVLTNVNANALVLTRPYLEKVAVIARELRPYGVRVYLTARFSAPMEVGGLPTADPLEPAVCAWWKEKADEIHGLIPDFGGFLVKANSEGQPGPQSYGRNHADGANMLAEAVAPHGGIVMWRAFVYEPVPGVDRLRQAHLEFAPLDGKFRDNVVVQIKNGPLDFMPREPFHPLFGAMPHTRLALELQITQEYLGGSVQLAYLAPLWKECLDADTHVAGNGSTIARILADTGTSQAPSVIAGVANIGNDRNWTGHPLAQANWYAFGRLAWDPSLDAGTIAQEWTAQTFDNNAKVNATLPPMLLRSREIVVDYSMPLGLHHIMAEGHHYGPGPWATASRPDWGSAYYHQASATGLGADRTETGSNALGQYAPQLRAQWGNPDTCPEEFLLWFHHVAWDKPLRSGRPLWDELCHRYQRGVDAVRILRKDWQSLADSIDAERHAHVAGRLARQEKDAIIWKDSCLLYFQTYSKRPLPAGIERPAHELEHYKKLKYYFAPGHPGAK